MPKHLVPSRCVAKFSVPPEGARVEDSSARSELHEVRSR